MGGREVIKRKSKQVMEGQRIYRQWMREEERGESGERENEKQRKEEDMEDV